MQNPKDVIAIQSIGAIPTILEAVAAITGLRFVCVARVTQDSWTTCAVLDQLNFGLKPGDGLDITTTLCEEVRDTNKSVIIDHVNEDDKYRNHHTPRIYGFQSYISVPLSRKDGEYFGTLCALDPLPAKLSNTATIASMNMFCELISLQLESEIILAETYKELMDERETAELREQFIAVLGHDLRNPLNAILTATQMLNAIPDLEPKINSKVQMIQNSAQRISVLIDDVVDFTKGRMGGGIAIDLRHENSISQMLEHVVAELISKHSDREVITEIDPNIALLCDSGRIGQLLSNLLKNALVHGDANQPIQVAANCKDGLFKISVTNGGPVLSRDTIKELFKPFVRGVSSNSSDGLGLGLFIINEIARSHGGQIRVLSDENETSFIFTIKTAEFIERRNHTNNACEFVEKRETLNS